MRVLVTRPEADAQRTAARLAERGHAAILAPVTVIVPTNAPPPGDPWDAVLLTSANAVPALRQLSVGTRPVFAVGPRTAAAARAAGIADVHEAEGAASALAALVQAMLPAGTHLLHAAAQDRKDEPERSLLTAGYPVLVWETYRAKPVEEPPEALADGLRTGRIDAALHFSRRSASILVRLVEAAGLLQPFRALPHLCLSADVAAALHQVGGTVEVAAAPREEILLDLVDRLG
jgi:uroporphyrinogen-III synthase